MKTRLTLLTLSTLLMAGMVDAQDAKRTGVAHAWPRTFSGQPDFEFDKKEVMEERAKLSEPQGLPAPKPPTLADLLEDEKVELLKPVVAVDVSDTSGVSGSTALIAKLNDFTLALGNLPSLTEARALDVTEFRKSLRHAVRRAVAAYQFQTGKYSLVHMLQAVTLQAVVTSPVRYAVINNKQYQEGESFPMAVWAGPSDAQLMDVMAAQLPLEGSMTEAQAAQYQEAYEDAVKDLAVLRQTNPRELQKQVIVPATVLAIQHRKVVLEFNGQRHDLDIKFAY